MAKYRCIEEFSLQKYDGDGFETDDYYYVEANSTWITSEDNYRLVGGDIRLEKEDGWIEICKERLSQLFELVEED